MKESTSRSQLVTAQTNNSCKTNPQSSLNIIESNQSSSKKINHSRSLHRRVIKQQQEFSIIAQKIHGGGKESFKAGILYDVTKNVNRSQCKQITENWTGKLDKTDLVDILKKIPSQTHDSFFSEISHTEASNNLFISASEVINLIDNNNTTKLINKMRNRLPGFIDSESNKIKTQKRLLQEFRAVMQPTRIPSGWRINPFQLFDALKHLYFWNTDNDIWVKLWGDGREIGDRKATALAVSFVNNEQKVNGIDFHSTSDLWPLCLYYGGDDRWELEANIGKPGGKPGWLNDWLSSLPKSVVTFLSGDSKFMDAIEGEAGEFSPLSTSGFNMYSSDTKDSKSEYNKTSGRRSDLLKKSINRVNSNSLLPSIPLSHKILCIDHAAARIVSKLVQLRLAATRKLRESVKPVGFGLAEAEKSLSNLKQNMLQRSIQKAASYDLTTTEVKLNKKDAHLLLAQPGEFINTYRALLDGVASTSVTFQIDSKLQKLLGIPKSSLTEYEIETRIWYELNTMINILRNSDPEPKLKSGLPPNSTDPSHYTWGLEETEIQNYVKAADIFHRLFTIRYSSNDLTPYMIKLIDQAPALLTSLPISSLMRFATEQGEHLHYIHACYFYQHTQRGGAYKTVDPHFQILFWTYRILVQRVGDYKKSNDKEKIKSAQDFFQKIKQHWAASHLQRLVRGSSARRHFLKLKKAATMIQKNVRLLLLEKQKSQRGQNAVYSVPAGRPKSPQKVTDIIIVGRIPTPLIKKYKTKDQLISQIEGAGARVFTNFPLYRLPKPGVKIDILVVCNKSECTSKKPSAIISKALARGWKVVSFEFLSEFVTNSSNAMVKPYLLDDLFLKNHRVRINITKTTHRHAGGPGERLPFAELKQKKKVTLRSLKTPKTKPKKIPKKQTGAFVQFYRENVKLIKPHTLSKKDKMLKLQGIWKRFSKQAKANYVKSSKLQFQMSTGNI